MEVCTQCRCPLNASVHSMQVSTLCRYSQCRCPIKAGVYQKAGVHSRSCPLTSGVHSRQVSTQCRCPLYGVLHSRHVSIEGSGHSRQVYIQDIFTQCMCPQGKYSLKVTDHYPLMVDINSRHVSTQCRYLIKSGVYSIQVSTKGRDPPIINASAQLS